NLSKISDHAQSTRRKDRLQIGCARLVLCVAIDWSKIDANSLRRRNMKTVRLTMAQALVRYLCAQSTEIEGRSEPLFAGVYGIFGHGNVTCLAEALEAVKDRLPTWRGQNEQSMALAAVACAKAKQRRQMMACTSSIGPGATNMVTAAAVAHANRLPVLLLA